MPHARGVRFAFRSRERGTPASSAFSGTGNALAFPFLRTRNAYQVYRKKQCINV